MSYNTPSIFSILNRQKICQIALIFHRHLIPFYKNLQNRINFWQIFRIKPCKWGFYIKMNEFDSVYIKRGLRSLKLCFRWDVGIGLINLVKKNRYFTSIYSDWSWLIELKTFWLLNLYQYWVSESETLRQAQFPCKIETTSLNLTY